MKWGYGKDAERLGHSTYHESAWTARRARVAGVGALRPVVIEGDSWFAIRSNLLTWLDSSRWQFIGQADPGDTFENMIFGTAYNKRTWRRKPVQFDGVLRLVRRNNPACLLFSGGGNDIVGQELEMLLNHAGTGLPLLRSDALLELMAAFEAGYRYKLQALWDIDPLLPVITHGYGYAQPTGDPYALKSIGPWLRPAFVKKGITDFATAADIVRVLIDAFNDLQGQLAHDYEHFHRIDFRQDIGSDDWQDEIHPKSRVFRDLAQKLEAKMDEVVTARN